MATEREEPDTPPEDRRDDRWKVVFEEALARQLEHRRQFFIALERLRKLGER